MECVKINRNTPVTYSTQFNVVDMVEKDGELVIKLAGNECYEVNQGDLLTFKRAIKCENGDYHIIKKFVSVKSEDSEHYIHTTLPEKEKIFISKDTDSIKREIEYIDDIPRVRHIIDCSVQHNIFAQDLALNNGQEIYFKDANGNDIENGNYDLIAIPEYSPEYNIDEPEITRLAQSADCITSIEEIDSCGKDFEKYYRKIYNFLPNSFKRSSIVLYRFDESISDKICYFEKKFNPFYYYTINKDSAGTPTELDSYGNPVKHCHFYEDYWWSCIRWETNEEYVNCGSTLSCLCLEKNFYNVTTAMYSDANETILGVEDYFSSSYAKIIEESLIPPIIDMERVKYFPVMNVAGDNYDIVTGITIYPHFRKRKRMLNDEDRKINSYATSGNVYFDGWNIDEDYGISEWWNGMTFNGMQFSSEAFNAFYENNWNKADLIGYLNFTDNDVYYRKSKISKSFFRFSYYNSKDPIEQRLLGYSTVFLDGSLLYGKYMNQTDEHYENNEGYTGNKNTIGVFFDSSDDELAKERIDTSINITNEYDLTSCSEGFNIYLFADDVPLGNDVRTIYMKVEFNHAGNGKTIPLIIWPKRGNTFWGLTIDNFLENLYIPIEIREIDGKYVYTINKGVFEDGNLKLSLFEPKLDVT